MVTLNWDAKSGTSYSIFAASNLDDFLLLDDQSNLTNGAASFTIDLEATPNQFFQVREDSSQP